MDPYYVHTSDRILYKRCRMKWDFISRIRRGLEPIDATPNIHLWFGTGFHFALEDYHGYNRFGDPVKALEAFYMAFNLNELPEGSDEMIALGIDMLEYYKKWQKHREVFNTVWIDGVPQTEVRFALELTEASERAGRPVIYRGTIDRLARDSQGLLWIEDYKTAARIDTNKLANDPQISTYVWAAEQYFEEEIVGMLYTQFAKETPKPPKMLVNGGLSVDKRQKTTHRLYREVLLDMYPKGNFPRKYVDFLGHLAEQEAPEGDRFIRRDQVERNRAAKEMTYRYIMKEAHEMVNPDLPIYPNPTRDCSWDCSQFREVCIAIQEGGDWEYMLENFYREKSEEDETWRTRVKYPNKQKR